MEGGLTPLRGNEGRYIVCVREWVVQCQCTGVLTFGNGEESSPDSMILSSTIVTIPWCGLGY